jgi:ubiquinone/menaquinone biosynthesis C-methylase UbiE
MAPPESRTVDNSNYRDWRNAELSASWSKFNDAHIAGKTVLDFGCGTGELADFLNRTRHPARMIGVDIDPSSVKKARDSYAGIDFIRSTPEHIRIPDASVDTILAFDCMEHVMRPATIIKEWHRVLRPGGSVLIEWYPFRGPYGPHMEALIPIPWAHVLFGQRAMFRAAAAIYDSPNFHPRFWDLDEQGHKKPNKWRQWSTFKEQGFINELTLPEFRRMAVETGFKMARFDIRTFGGSTLKRTIGKVGVSLPLIGEYFVSHVIIELQRNSPPTGSPSVRWHCTAA